MSGPSYDDLIALAAQLRQVLGAVEAGELPAERDQVAWLRGSIAMADLISRSVGAAVSAGEPEADAPL